LRYLRSGVRIRRVGHQPVEVGTVHVHGSTIQDELLSARLHEAATAAASGLLITIPADEFMRSCIVHRLHEAGGVAGQPTLSTGG